MASPAKQPPKKSGGWGSLLSGAVANLESRLDTILADDPEASVKERAAAEKAKKEALASAGRTRTNSGNLGVPSAKASTDVSREGSRTRGSDRLAERLAKATAPKTASQAPSAVPSRVASPAIDSEGVRTSADSIRSIADTKSTTIETTPDKDAHEEGQENKADGEVASDKGTLQMSGLPINPARVSVESGRPSIEVTSGSVSNDPSSRPSLDLANGTEHIPKSNTELESELVQLRTEHAKSEKERQEEMHVYMEKIDALQAKLQYLAKETLAAAKEANASASSGSDGAKLAAKDERIALLMEEGEKLSKSEMRHMQTIKKLRSRTMEEDKAASELKKRLDRAERSESDLKQKVRRAEVAQRQAEEKAKQIALIEKQVDELRTDRENAAELVRNLTVQLKEAKDKADRAEKEANSKAAEIDKGKISSLENELEDAQIEKKLAEDRSNAEIKKLREEVERQSERFNIREMEMKNEISGLETRLEVMRARAEEASSEGANDGGSVKLLRQVETLQSQYSLAKENWETIESSLTARISALEKERDETTKREADVRKKARDLGLKSRKAEDEVESLQEQCRNLTQELNSQKQELKGLQDKLDASSVALEDAKADFERQRKLWEAELAQRIEEERAKWPRGPMGPGPGTMRQESPSTTRKTSGWNDIASARKLNIDPSLPRPISRRSSNMPTPRSVRSPQPPPLDNFQNIPPALLRQDSLEAPPSGGMPPTPSIEIETDFASNSPQQTINDLVSISTAGAGPSVQLVERLSQAVRRLESEKASFKDELARLSAQRDDARNEVVTLMREVETKRAEEKKAEEMEDLQRRYNASLEILGEREEEVQELKQDLVELKGLYRELAEEKFKG